MFGVVWVLGFFVCVVISLNTESVCAVAYIVPDTPIASFWFQARGKESVLNRYLVPGHLGHPQTVAD